MGIKNKAIILCVITASVLAGCGNETSVSTNTPLTPTNVTENTPQTSTPSSGSSQSTNSKSLTSSSEYSGSTWNKTAGNTTGNDWTKMNSSQKKDIVGGVILDWKANKYKVSVGTDYFISALDAFYGDEATNSTNLAKAMSMIGVSGKVISTN